MAETESRIMVKAKSSAKNLNFITLTSFSGYMAHDMLLFVLPIYFYELGMVSSQVGLFASVISISSMLIRPWSGYKIDTIGRKSILLIGLSALIIISLMYAFVEALFLLLIIRFMHGIAWGAFTTAAGTIAADNIPAAHLGKGMGFYNLAPAIAMLFAPAIGIWLVQTFSFAHLFYLSAAISVGAILLTIPLKYANIKPAKKVFNPLDYEKTALKPSIVNFLISCTMGAISSFIVLYALQRGIDNAGFFITIFALFTLISRPIAGWLVDKKGYNIVIIPGIVFFISTTIIIPFAQTIPVFVFAAILYGCGLGFLRGSIHALTVKYVALNRRGVATSMFHLSIDFGMAAGALLGGLLIDIIGFSLMYLCFTITNVLALIIYLDEKKRRQKRGRYISKIDKDQVLSAKINC